MENINEITSKLFIINYEKEFEDDEIGEKYFELANSLIKKYNWHNVYLYWYDFLIKKCKTEKEIINFANLFWYYEGYKYFIPNAVEFCAYFYANISMNTYIENEPVIDGITWNVLKNSGVYLKNELFFENFEPYKDPILTKTINDIKEGK